MPASRSTCAWISARPASRPSASPCSNASLCASACRSARPPTVAILCEVWAPSMAGTAHSATAAAGFGLTSDKIAGALAAKTYRALFRHALRDHDDFLLRRLDIGEFHRSARFHVVLEDFRRPLRHVLEYFLLHLRFCAAQRDRQGVGSHLAQQRLDAAVIDVEQIVEHEQQVFDLLMHLAVGFLDLAHLLAELLPFHGIQDIGRGAR